MGAPSQREDRAPCSAPSGEVPTNMKTYTDITRPRRWSAPPTAAARSRLAVLRTRETDRAEQHQRERGTSATREAEDRRRSRRAPPHHHRPRPEAPARRRQRRPAQERPTPWPRAARHSPFPAPRAARRARTPGAASGGKRAPTSPRSPTPGAHRAHRADVAEPLADVSASLAPLRGAERGAAHPQQVAITNTNDSRWRRSTPPSPTPRSSTPRWPGPRCATR